MTRRQTSSGLGNAFIGGGAKGALRRGLKQRE